MSTREQILAETLARLEAERFQPMPPGPVHEPLPPVTTSQARRNAQLLLDAIGHDQVLADWAADQTGSAA